MATKLGRKEMPSGLSSNDFTYQGRPASDQGDFGSDVGIADGSCVNQFGSNNNKYYHGGVVKSTDGRWWVYLEWGRNFAGCSWNGRFAGQDFQFVQCDDEADARKFFAKQWKSKNTSRAQKTMVGGVEIWAGKPGKDAYIVQSLATRQRGLPDAYKIKDGSGVQVTAPVKKKAPAKKAAKSKAPLKSYDPQVIDLATSLVGGTRSFTRAMAAAAGVTPTKKAIDQVRDQLIPAALTRIAKVGPDINKQVKDQDLVNITKMVAALVPRPIPRSGQDATEAILSGGNMLVLQQDLDAFEAALAGEDFNVDATASTPGVDPDAMLNAQLRYLDPNGDGRWLAQAFPKMSANRHGYIRNSARLKHIFEVVRPDRDVRFMAAAQRVAAMRKGRFSLHANLQPKRQDLGQDADLYSQANIILAIHGTRPVNIAPIMGTNFRLPKSLPGAQITGANFGHGVYFAVDWRKSYGYTGRGYWGHSGGDVRNRGCFMFLCDMVLGDAYRAPSTGSWNAPPNGKDSVFGVGGDRGHRLENDEHVIFSPDYQRIRYLVEFDWLT